MKILIVLFCLALAFVLFVKYLEGRSFYFPSRAMARTPGDAGLAFEEITFKAADGVTLNGWFVPAPGARRSLVYCHGNAGNISDRLEKVRSFRELGFNVFIFDYRGYGRSAGRPSEKGLYLDAQAAFDWLAARFDVGKLPVVVYGASLGGAVAVDLATRRPVAALITEATFSSVRDMADAYYPWVPKFLISVRYDSARKAAGLTIPKLFMHSPKDEVIPFRFARTLFAAAAEPKMFVELDGWHNDDFFQSEGRVRETIRKFLEKNRI